MSTPLPAAPAPVTPRRRGPIARFFIGLWNAVNFTRRLVLNILFLVLLVLFFGVLGMGERTTPLQEKTTLVLAPKGKLVEQYTTDPFMRGLAEALGDDSKGEVQLRDLLRVIDAAGRDANIGQVYLRLDELQVGGLASLREVAAALQKLRASGKPVIAFTESMGQFPYLLAAQANEVYLDPMGGIELSGLASYRPYMREGLQDKLGVDMQLFKVGTYKSAAEPFIRDDASPEAKEADLFWMNDLWQRHLADIASARKTTVPALTASIDGMAAGVQAVQGDLAQYALQQKLVDGLKTRQEIDALLTKRGVADDDAEGGFRQIGLRGYLKHLDTQLPTGADVRPQLAVVVAEGSISGGEQPRGTVGGETTSQLLRDARQDDKVKAIVLRVNSPGGEVFASEQIRREVELARKDGKPVVVSMGDVAASGGYWISMNADRIYADPSTITGSIGIFGLIPNFTRALDKIGVHTDGVGTTALAGAFDPTKPLDPQVATIIQSVIDKGYRDFTGRVAAARKKTVEQVDAVAQGRVWSGAQAKERGLVDAFGGLQAAIDDAATRGKLGKAGDYRVQYIEDGARRVPGFLGRLTESRLGMALLQHAGWLHSLLQTVHPALAEDAIFLQRVSAQAAAGKPVVGVAHCFCRL